ncbi:gliding motility-associated peptidyl-prolyl isomerase GldI [uncultured Winogradskyella sp.]|uniref:gliding motility-associated peptidyl-prolyl isomerase GldI n=1 Tax=uncultured Winogradskyella sp. TaxID=395353 RepID=UPI002626E1AD|nr:gliding motility-associated peptidyl-prolyl isomerase GldI [uncultured Winogradskyella sp.]
MRNLLLLFAISFVCFNCKSPEARIPESAHSGSFLKESAARNKKLNEEEQQRIKAIIKTNPDIDYIASKSGFWYYYTVKSDNQSVFAGFGDVVNFKYNISDLNGTEIYSSTQRTYIMDKQELFTGLREGLKLMNPGDQITFIFPSQKAYGYYGDDKKIGTNVPLICDVTLNTITQEND